MKELQIVKNADNEYVMPFGNVGYVDEVNGTSAAEVPGFVPTCHELIQLVQFWERVALETEWWWFSTGIVGSSDMRQHAFARRRVSRIWDLLGEEEVGQAIDRVHAEFGKAEDPRLWDIFLHGDEAQRSAVREELYKELDKLEKERSKESEQS